jgi:hypothetical protein
MKDRHDSAAPGTPPGLHHKGESTMAIWEAVGAVWGAWSMAAGKDSIGDNWTFAAYLADGGDEVWGSYQDWLDNGDPVDTSEDE